MIGMMIESERLPVFMAVKDVALLLHGTGDYLRELPSEYEKWMPHIRAGLTLKFATLEGLRAFTVSAA